ncbi:CinA-like protein [Neisseria meningitidis]|nr:CinA-like protein [Neisseria meningitidis]
MNAFNLIIIGDEILHGSRQDKHFVFFKSLLESKGLKLNQVQYLPDEPDLLVKQLRRSFSDGMPTFVTGGIGATPDAPHPPSRSRCFGFARRPPRASRRVYRRRDP